MSGKKYMSRIPKEGHILMETLSGSGVVVFTSLELKKIYVKACRNMLKSTSVFIGKYPSDKFSLDYIPLKQTLKQMGETVRVLSQRAQFNGLEVINVVPRYRVREYIQADFEKPEEFAIYLFLGTRNYDTECLGVFKHHKKATGYKNQFAEWIANGMVEENRPSLDEQSYQILEKYKKVMEKKYVG